MWPFSPRKVSKFARYELNALASLTEAVERAQAELSRLDEEALPVETRLDALDMPVADASKRMWGPPAAVVELNALRELGKRKKEALLPVVLQCKDFIQKYGK